MARYYRYILLLPLFLMAACQEGGDAGDLLGQWRLTGTDDRYVGFSGSIAWFHSTDRREVFANFQHVGDSLFIQCSSIYGSPSDTTFIEKSFGLKPFKKANRGISISIDLPFSPIRPLIEWRAKSAQTIATLLSVRKKQKLRVLFGIPLTLHYFAAARRSSAAVRK